MIEDPKNEIDGRWSNRDDDDEGVICILHAPSKFYNLGIAFAMENNSNPSAMAAAASCASTAEWEGRLDGAAVASTAEREGRLDGAAVGLMVGVVLGPAHVMNCDASGETKYIYIISSRRVRLPPMCAALAFWIGLLGFLNTRPLDCSDIFLASAEAENVLKGTALSDPIVMWFADKSMSWRLIWSSTGMVPVSWLFPRSSSSRRAMRRRVLGIVPVKLLLPRDRVYI